MRVVQLARQVSLVVLQVAAQLLAVPRHAAPQPASEEASAAGAASDALGASASRGVGALCVALTDGGVDRADALIGHGPPAAASETGVFWPAAPPCQPRPRGRNDRSRRCTARPSRQPQPRRGTTPKPRHRCRGHAPFETIDTTKVRRFREGDPRRPRRPVCLSASVLDYAERLEFYGRVRRRAMAW